MQNSLPIFDVLFTRYSVMIAIKKLNGNLNSYKQCSHYVTYKFTSHKFLVSTIEFHFLYIVILVTSLFIADMD